MPQRLTADPGTSPSAAAAPAIRLRGLQRHFGEVAAVDGVDLDIASGEFFSMLGPSGSGKTTVLRLIAGFDTPTAGGIELFGQPVEKLAPYDRQVNTVFQDYALFPHMNVVENVEFGLRVRKVPKGERRRMATEALDRMQLSPYAKRKPGELSGGQRQRVALARAIVVGPKVLLLDEPLGALDRKLREEMQVELKQLQRTLGITFVFVTHDQEEALTLSDRVAVFSGGKIQQVDSPEALYGSPANEFVATFVGTSNVFDPAESDTLLGLTGTHTVRPEKIRLAPLAAEGPEGSGAGATAARQADGTAVLTGEITERAFIGTGHRTLVRVGQRIVTVLEPADGAQLERGQAVGLSIRPDDIRPL